MKTWLKNALALLVGIVIGSGVNMGIITVSDTLIALPPGVDPSNFESIKAAMPFFEPQHFVMPFLAHALGTLAGAFVAVTVAVGPRLWVGGLVGAFFMVGGMTMAFSLPAPAWFVALDLGLAYLPMAWLGGRLALTRQG